MAALWQPLGLVWTCAVLGLLVGSFLNVVIGRLPRMMARAWSIDCLHWLHEQAPGLLVPELQAGELDAAAVLAQHAAPGSAASVRVYNLSQPPSHCPQCHAPIRAWQNIPLLSYALLRGRCAGCARPIPLRYPFVELLSALLAAAVAATFGATLLTVAGLGLVWTLVALTFIDLDTLYLPDDLTLPLVWAGLLVNAVGGLVPLADAVWGAAAGYGLLWTVCTGFRLLTGKDGMGAGDFKLLAALGAWLGWAALPGILLLGSLLGALCGGLAIALAGHDRRAPIPFGPFLAYGGLVSLFYPGPWW